MGNLRIIGLGPSDGSDLTARAIEAIEDDSVKFLRTEAHDAVAYFRSRGIPYTSYDYLYETKDDFDSVYRTIAEDLIERSKSCKISYFVPGHPLIAEKTVVYLLAHNPEIEIIHGLSFIEPLLSLVKQDPIEGLKFVDGDNFSDLDFDVHTNTIVTQVYNSRIVRELKLALSELYGDEYEIYVLSHAGNAKKECVFKRPIYTLDRYDDYGHETSLFIPKSEVKNALSDLITLVRTLRRSKESGADAYKTHESIKAKLIEEAYTACHAIETGDDFGLEDALGNLLYQIVFHSELGAEAGLFTFQTMIQGVVEKMRNKHPEVFSRAEVERGEKNI